MSSSFPPEPARNAGMPPLPPPPPPYLPGYAVPQPAYGGGPAAPNKYQQMARASYIAPIIAFALGCLTRTTVEGHPMTGLIIGGVNIFLIIAGLCLAIIALSGMSKVGRDGVLGPAITGLVINVLIVTLLVVG